MSMCVYECVYHLQLVEVLESILGWPACQIAQIGSDSSPAVHRAPLACRQTAQGVRRSGG